MSDHVKTWHREVVHCLTHVQASIPVWSRPGAWLHGTWWACSVRVGLLEWAAVGESTSSTQVRRLSASAAQAWSKLGQGVMRVREAGRWLAASHMSRPRSVGPSAELARLEGACVGIPLETPFFSRGGGGIEGVRRRHPSGVTPRTQSGPSQPDLEPSPAKACPLNTGHA